MRQIHLLPTGLRGMGWMLVFLLWGGVQAEEGTPVPGRMLGESSGHTLYRALNSLKDQEFDAAGQLFEAYIEGLSGAEQRLYRDVALVADKDERKRYRKALEDQKAAMCRRFWNRHDPVPLTQANERLMEHYRRVAYARRYFSRGGFPWDERGEIYVRFGQPDHISRYNRVRRERDAEVQSARLSFAAKHLSSFEVQEGYPTFPVGGDDRWEYWVYTGVGKGIEVTFVDEQGEDHYTFPSISDGLWFSSEVTSQLLALRGTIKALPALYTPDYLPLPIDFSYDLVDYRGPDGRTRLEMTFGLQASEAVHLTVDERSGMIYLEHVLVLYDTSWQEVYRVKDRMSLPPPGDVQVLDGAFIPGRISVDLPPGTYHLDFQVRDAGSDKSQVYRQAVVLEDYTGTERLRLSDVELAFAVSPSDDTGEPFVKNGLRVLPRACRTFYGDQDAFVYFEIYNLSRDVFGQTQYRVAYTLREQRQGLFPVRMLRNVGRLLRLAKSDRKVTIAYDQNGDRSDERAYVALDLGGTDPGDHMVEVAVTDLLTGRRVFREAAFRMVP